MKKILLQASAALFSLSLCMGASVATASAQEATGTIEVGKIFKKKIKISVPNPSVVSSKMQVRSLAPNISAERVFFIISTNTAPNGENIAPGQQSTALDEGGPQMELYLIETGYGTTYPQITMAGQTISPGALESRDPYCIVNGEVVLKCPVGSTVTGFIYTINLSGFQSGRFTFLNRSVNNSNVTGETSLNIL